MFDYLVNSYNQSPSLIAESDLDQGYLYVKYTEAPYLVLPESLENLKSQHKRKFWYNLKRSQRQYEARFGVLHFEFEFLERAEMSDRKWGFFWTFC